MNMMTTGSAFLLRSLFKILFSVFLAAALLCPAQAQEGGKLKPADIFSRAAKNESHLGEKIKPSAAEQEKYAYIVGSEDALAIEVYDNPDLKGEYTVSANGTIVFPLLGQVRVGGLTVAAIKEKLTGLLEKDYLYNPIVSVTVSKYLSQKVKIMGNVGKPGIYYLDSPTRLFDLLTKAEGISPQMGVIMSGQKAHIMRNDANTDDDSKLNNIYIDLHELLVQGKDEANIYLQDGDVVYIPHTNSIHVIGEVKNPGSFPYEQGLTVLKAISLAGGATKKADPDKTVIKRLNKKGKVVEMEAKMDSLLEPDDIVDVPLSFW